MVISREAVLPAALIAVAILAHAYFTQPSRYQFFALQPTTAFVARGDTRTGDVVLCEKDYRGPQQDETFFKCSPGESAAAEWVIRNAGPMIAGAMVLVFFGLAVCLDKISDKIRARRKP
jgi:hypothetical protein